MSPTAQLTEPCSAARPDWIAIIDDDASIRVSLARLFRAHEIPAETFGSAEEFLQRTARELPRCILLDVQLIGGLSGTDLLERLNARGATPPVIFMTGQDELKPALRARIPELDSCLRKPFDMSGLIARVRPHLEPAGTPGRFKPRM